MRASNGHPAPYGVKYWEIGNEIYGKWEKGHCDAETYAARYLEFRKAMKAVDADIQLFAVGHTDAGWNREAVEDGENGFLFTPGDTEGLARAIRTLFSDTGLLARVGERNRQKAFASFDVGETVRKTEAVYLPLVESRSKR